MSSSVKGCVKYYKLKKKSTSDVEEAEQFCDYIIARIVSHCQFKPSIKNKFSVQNCQVSNVRNGKKTVTYWWVCGWTYYL